jgi:hypothetical protein
MEIFGPLGSQKRQTQLSFIDVRTEIMHPKIFIELTRLKGLYRGLMAGTMYAVFDPVLKDFVKSNIIDGQTGYAFFMDHFNDIIYSSNDSSIRDLRIKLLTRHHDKCMYRYIVVIPAGLRDLEINEEGRAVEDDINGLYRKLIRSANTISIFGNDTNNAALNTVRWNLQTTFVEIYEYIESILKGKKGFLLAKWASRAIHGSTRNVITAMSDVPRVLGAPDAITVNDTACGLHQYLKGTVELSTFNIKDGPLGPMIAQLPNAIDVIDPKTLKRVSIRPSPKTVERWGSEIGIEKSINAFAKPDTRHKPIVIDGHFAALIYRDGNSFRVFYDIDDLPSDKSRKQVKPISWAEMYYISVYQQCKKLAGYVTRYPITELGSIYPSEIYLQSTVRTDKLIPLDDNWQPVSIDQKAYNMPIYGEPFYDSMSVHTSKVPGLSADKNVIL